MTVRNPIPLTEISLLILAGIAGRGHRAANGWLKEIAALPVDFSDSPQQFINLNIEQDQKLLRHYLSP